MLHVGGKSWRKNTIVVLECWLAHPEFPLLTIVSSQAGVVERVQDAQRQGLALNVKLLGSGGLTINELRSLQKLKKLN